MSIFRNSSLVPLIKNFIKKLLQLVFTLFVSSHIVSMFRLADPVLISFLDFCRDEFTYDDASTVFKSYAEDKLTVPSNFIRSELRSSFFIMSVNILENWTLSRYLDTGAQEFQNFSVKGFLNCYRVLAFLSYPKWLHFWFVTLHPIMPWSFFWDSFDTSSVNESSYKIYIRSGIYSLLKVILGQDVTETDRWLVSNLLGYITAVLCNDIFNKF